MRLFTHPLCVVLCLVLAWLKPAPASAQPAPPVGIALTPRASQGRLLQRMDPSSLGIHWTNRLPVEKYIERQNLMNGSGVALGDYDGDGRCDIFLCGKFSPSALLRNLGNWRFENVAELAGAALPNQITTGAVFADLNGDAKLDLLVTSFLGPSACLINLGGGKFTNLTAQLGLASKGGSTSMALGDLDGDGDLDLYVNYFGVEALLRDGVAFSTRMVGGRPVVAGPLGRRLKIIDGKVQEFGEPDILYRNDGGKFTPLPWEQFFTGEDGRPMPPPNDFGLAVQIRDIDLDGDPDIYICSDFQTPDRLWLNDGAGRFREIERLALRSRSYASMGVDFADLDRDGDLDFFTAEMLSRDHARHIRQSSPKSPERRQIGEFSTREDVARNALYVNRGDGTYAETAWFSGVAASDWSWTPIFTDVDLDGLEDLLISNGHMHDVNDRDMAANTAQATVEQKRAMLPNYPVINGPNAAYRNLGGLKFADAAESWGFNATEITHGMALGDLDNDGDLDVVGNPVNAAPLIYQNTAAAPRVAVRLRGRAPNTQGIGARITLRGGPFDQMQEMLAGGRYLSGDEPVRCFAAGTNTGPLSLEVLWRGGSRSVVSPVQANHLYELDEASASAPAPREQPPEPPVPWFEDLTAKLNHTHTELPFDDFERQPLLPRKLSQLGPGLGWFDWNGDGHDDLIVGSGRGGKISVLRGDGQSGFQAESLGPKPLRDDSAGLLGWPSPQGPRLLAALSQAEAPGGAAVEIFGGAAAGQLAHSAISLGAASPGPIALADFEGDGDLDLFVGARFIPGRYPEAAESKLFRNDDGIFIEDPKAFPKITGLASAAIFSDLNGDGFAELIVAEEWGPIRVFENARGTFAERTAGLGLAEFTGWWNSVTAGDLDGDGRLDLVAGNWGANTVCNRSAQGPWQVDYGDFAGDGRVAILESYFNSSMQAQVPWRDLTQLSAQLPWLSARFPTHLAFSTATIEAILGAKQPSARRLQARMLASVIFWNRGARFEMQPLPDEAQWTPVFGLNIADFNNDSREDLFVAQNFLAVRPEEDRLDAGRGLLLEGRACGQLAPVTGQSSGLKIYGEQRGSAAGDFDEDGRVDLAVSQNGAATRLFRNARSAPGLRVRLQGPPGNPRAHGAVLRARSANGLGPARELRAGNGYWSQDSAVLVFPAGASEIIIRWPGGKETAAKIPENSREIEISPEGTARKTN